MRKDISMKNLLTEWRKLLKEEVSDDDMSAACLEVVENLIPDAFEGTVPTPTKDEGMGTWSVRTVIPFVDDLSTDLDTDFVWEEAKDDSSGPAAEVWIDHMFDGLISGENAGSWPDSYFGSISNFKEMANDEVTPFTNLEVNDVVYNPAVPGRSDYGTGEVKIVLTIDPNILEQYWAI